MAEVAHIPLVPRWLPAVAMVSALFAVGAGAGIATIDFSKTVRAQGIIVPQGGMISVAADQSGTIARRATEEGRVVAAGGLLLAVHSREEGEGAGVTVEQGILEDREAALGLLHESRLQSLVARDAQLRAELSGLNSELGSSRVQLELLLERVRLREEALERLRVLSEQGYVAANTVLSREADLLSERQAVELMRASIERLLAQRAGKEAELSGIESARAELLATLRQDELAIVQDRSTLRMRSERLYVAPADARVVALPYSDGQAVQPGVTLAVLAPTGRLLECELFVASNAAAPLEVGQRVRLEIDALPKENYGTLGGAIVAVSPAMLQADDLNLHGLAISGQVVRVRVRLDATTVGQGSRSSPIHPGMSVQGIIEVEERSLWTMLTSTLLRRG